ncbi:hypothetical protein J2T02_001886 [Chitinophaga terrae (ex Kim and Jung 2007)]|uniref:S41 family peptidase n=1 Tax=Chitinophaga terrae (ex Kim and Jung 2007) TaxID=408074 RepID=UPI0027828E70|nr:S41 family peptidase [Chitinophaga terrae (ex Kim and Jung 2007)]MDQ0106775.1 hypothetical protein [Chitinophaga terrae (ex Kim and Jung 2007)]
MTRWIISGAAALMTLCCFRVSAQDKKLSNLTKEDFIADFRLAAEILKKQHPNPYKWIDSASFQRKVDSLMEKAAAAPDVVSCLQYSPIYLVRDVHTNLGVSADNAKELYSMINLFPYPVIIERGKIFINIKGGVVPFGAEVTSINNVPAEDIIQALSTPAYSDGYITSGLDRLYPNFQVMYSLLSPHETTFQVSYIAPGSRETKKTTLPFANPTQAFHDSKMAVHPLNQLQRSYVIYNNYYDDTKTGVLTVNTFGINEADAYKEFSEFFRELNRRKYKQVIIDVRSNGGGNPAISALLYSFLTREPFRNVYNYRTRTIDIALPEYAIADNGRRLSDDDIQTQKNFLYQRFDKDKNGIYVGNARLRDGLLENFPPDKDAFDGKVYVLAGGGTVSAATYFASLVQQNKRGVIIGHETGSGEAATTAAWFMKYLLPRTKSVLSVPMSELYFFDAATDKGHGVMPDKEVPVDKFISYIQAGKDPEMSYTMELIRNGK